ncbi:MAG: prepilin-type N-terminal cleavage/methylation domain-containing protein [Thiomicrospira sp.]|uniref:prepilin-type N-terminal cleavage/methylation domain-containing protein n=1 Tax=Thiomicrospira sp. TaxID=935 RepID=UPI001A0BC145|nr:prepilin-type N-terminal cleavage/methylation domain-containing protein [Thiomicrospira sp.]MBE0493720.1 prepilin-type N-terminal cleavage/methylation domain-containing protein [Thiomicrospira sp.]
MQPKNKQKGFTLIEIAIVLVIIGLLLGGVLKGQELIKSAKVKAAAGDVNAYGVALIGYQDRYGDLFQNGVDGKYLGATLGTSVFAATTDATAAANSELMLNELVGRGFITSKSQHPLGGNIVLIKNGPNGTLTADTLAMNASTTPQTFNWAVCYTAISSEEDAQMLVRAIDGTNTTFPDDFGTGTARLVVDASYASAAAIVYAAANTTVCFEI